MAKAADQNTNEPPGNEVTGAIAEIESGMARLLSERGEYMRRCRGIREEITAVYDAAHDRGISKKLLKLIVQEREIERKIGKKHADLDPDELNELDMLANKAEGLENKQLDIPALSRQLDMFNGDEPKSGEEIVEELAAESE